MTASRAGRALGISREQVFKLLRQGKLMRAGYRLIRGKHRTLVTAESVLCEKTRRKAANGRCKGETGIDRTPALKTPPAPLQGAGTGKDEVKHGPCGSAEARLVYTFTELTPEEKCRAACFAARDMGKHYEELAKTAAGCSKENAKACADFHRLCFWFAALCVGCAALCVILAAVRFMP